MTSQPAKKPGTRVEPKYEDDLRELFERLLQGARIPAEPREEEREDPADAEPTDEAEPAAEAADATDTEAAEDEAAEPEGSEPEPEPAADAEEPAQEKRLARGRLRRWAVPALAAAVAAAVGASAFFAGRATAPDEDEPRRQVAVRAGEIATTLYNYDYRKVDQYLARQSSVMTAKMAGEARQSRETISAIITGGKLVWTSRVTRVYVADVGAASASVIVELNGRVTNSKGISNLTGTVIRFELARKGGRWLVSKAPATLSVGEETATDLDGKPLPSASPSASPEKKSP